MCDLKEFFKPGFRYLIHGSSCSGKTTFINTVKKMLLENNRNPFLINGRLVESFFKMSFLENEESLSIPIESKMIRIKYTNKKINIVPNPGSEEYESLFKEKKYRDIDKFLSHKNPVLLIDDCDMVKLRSMKLLEKGFRKIFNKSFFGGIDLIFLGNDNNSFPENIFDSRIYKKDNLYKYFVKKQINNNVSTFAKTLPNIYEYRKNPLQNSGKITKDNINFFESKKVSKIENRRLYSDNQELIDEINKKCTEKLCNEIFYCMPTLIYTNSELLYYIQKNYKKLLKSQYFCVGQKVYNEIDKKEYIIKSFKFSDVEKGVIVGVVLERGDKTIIVETKEYKNNDLQMTILRIPLIPSYCLNISHLKKIKQGIFILSNFTTIENLEIAVNRIENIFFHYTFDINNFYFNTKMLKFINDRA